MSFSTIVIIGLIIVVIMMYINITNKNKTIGTLVKQMDAIQNAFGYNGNVIQDLILELPANAKVVGFDTEFSRDSRMLLKNVAITYSLPHSNEPTNYYKIIKKV